MTSSRTFSARNPLGNPLGDPCPQCGGPMAERPEYPYPVLVQALFGLSFVAFLLLGERVRGHFEVIVPWFVAQVVLGVVLVRGRIRAKRRVYRCIRCGQTLR